MQCTLNKGKKLQARSRLKSYTNYQIIVGSDLAEHARLKTTSSNTNSALLLT
jgi:hypothetical protein